MEGEQVAETGAQARSNHDHPVQGGGFGGWFDRGLEEERKGKKENGGGYRFLHGEIPFLNGKKTRLSGIQGRVNMEADRQD